MIDFLVQLDHDVFLWLNHLHAEWADPIMWWLSNRFVWIPLYVLVLFLIIRHYQWKSVGIILSFLILISLSDQFSGLLKNNVERFRPTHTEVLKESIHTLNNYFGGAYGFVSSHAANSFAFATMSSFFLAPFYRHYRWMIFVWAILVSYSRIYLGVHFPGDILGGAFLGIILAYIMRYLYLKFGEKCPNNYC